MQMEEAKCAGEAETKNKWAQESQEAGCRWSLEKSLGGT